MKLKNKPITLFCCAILLSLINTSAWALDTDKDQPINIESNTATYDDVTATSTYIGNVVSIQGSILVNSDKLVVYFVDGDADKLVFTGNKAKFKQTPNVGEKDIIGEALTGTLYPKKDLLVLMDNATVWKDNGTYSSNLIEYDIKTSLVKAGSKTSDNSRVHVVLKPKSVEQKSPEKPASAIIAPK